MMIDFGGLNTYFHMTNHYRKLKNVRSLIDCSPPKGHGKIDSKKSSITSANKSKIPSRHGSFTSNRSNRSHLPIHSTGLRKHDCQNEDDRKIRGNGLKERAASVPARPKTDETDGKSARPKSVEPLVKRVPFSRFNPQPSNNKSEEHKRSKSRSSKQMNSGENSPNNKEGSVKGLETDSNNSSAKSKKSDASAASSVGKTPKNIEDHEYLQFLLRITEDILRNDLYTNIEMQKVFDSHKQANKNRLDMEKMEEHINSLKKELNFPGANRPKKLDLAMCGCDPSRRELMKALMKCECGPDSDASRDCSKCEVKIKPTDTQMEVEIGGQHYDNAPDKKFKGNHPEGSIEADDDNGSSRSKSSRRSERSVESPRNSTKVQDIYSSRANSSRTESPETPRKNKISETSYSSRPNTAGQKILETPRKYKRSPTGSRKSSVSSFDQDDELPGFEDIEPSYTPKTAPRSPINTRRTSDRAQSNTNPKMISKKEEIANKKDSTSSKPALEEISNKSVPKKNVENVKPSPVVNKKNQSDKSLPLAKGTSSKHLSERAPEIVFHVAPGQECHCKIAYRKMALKIQNMDESCDTYVLVNGPVCIPKSLLEDRCIPVLLETSSSSAFDLGEDHRDYNKRDSVANYLSDHHDDETVCTDEVCEEPEIRSFSEIDMTSITANVGGSPNKQKSKSRSQNVDGPQKRKSEQRKSITISTDAEIMSKPESKPKSGEVQSKVQTHKAGSRAVRKDDMKTNLLLNNDYDLTPQRDVSVGDSSISASGGYRKYHFLMADKSTSMTMPVPSAASVIDRGSLKPLLEPSMRIPMMTDEDFRESSTKRQSLKSNYEESLLNQAFTTEAIDSALERLSSVRSEEHVMVQSKSASELNALEPVRTSLFEVPETGKISGDATIFDKSLTSPPQSNKSDDSENMSMTAISNGMKTSFTTVPAESAVFEPSLPSGDLALAPHAVSSASLMQFLETVRKEHEIELKASDVQSLKDSGEVEAGDVQKQKEPVKPAGLQTLKAPVGPKVAGLEKLKDPVKPKPAAGLQSLKDPVEPIPTDVKMLKEPVEPKDAAIPRMRDSIEIKVKGRSSDLQSLKEPPDRRTSVSLSNLSDVQEIFVQDSNTRSMGKDEGKDVTSVLTNETQGFQTAATPIAQTVRRFHSPNASEREHFVFQPHPSEDKITPTTSPLNFMSDEDFMKKLDREPSMVIRKDDARRIAEITGNLKTFRNVGEEDDNSSVRHQYQSSVANRMSLVSTNTGVSQLSADKLARFNPNYSDTNTNAKCCGMVKKSKKRGSASSVNSDVSASYPTRSYR